MFCFLKENLPERLQDATGHVVEWDHTANKKKKKKFHEQEDLLSCGGLRAVRLESQIT